MQEALQIELLSSDRKAGGAVLMNKVTKVTAAPAWLLLKHWQTGCCNFVEGIAGRYRTCTRLLLICRFMLRIEGEREGDRAIV